MLDFSLIHGIGRLLIVAIGVLGAIVLLTVGPHTKRRWALLFPVALATGLIAAVGAAFVVDDLWKPFPDALPMIVLKAVAASVAAVMTAILLPAKWSKKLIAGLAAILVATCSTAQVNQHFGEYPTIRAILGLKLANQRSFAASTPSSPVLISARNGQPLSDVWIPPRHLDPHGTISTARIPGTRSNFQGRDAWIYMPPAYTSTPRALLPVLVLLSGQPGSPRDWFDGGELATRMDGFALAHGGLAPVVVVVDSLGDRLANPMCVDSKRGNVFTYLSQDVPAWIRSNMTVDDDPKHWAVGGLSSGGTCSLQLALNAPAVYPTFIDISGEKEPTIGTHAETVQQVFDGNSAAFRKINPLDVMKTQHFPSTAGYLVSGKNDRVYGPDAGIVRAALVADGIPCEYAELPGDHSWAVWGAGLQQSLPWLAVRLGLAS